MHSFSSPSAAMEMAAKYICNHHCGRCPMLVVASSCPAECTLDTVAWQCWIRYFQSLAGKADETVPKSGSAINDPSPANAA